MPAPANLVHMNSVTTGTGNVTLSAVNGKQTFAQAFGTGGTDVFDYFISNQGAAEWERGTGHLSSATVLVRDTVLESSNSNALVNFSAGTKDVANDIPAALQYYKGGPLGTPDSGTLTNCTGLPTAGLVANAVTNAKLAQMASNTIKGNATGSTADPSDLTGTQVQALLTAQPTVQTFTSSGTWTKPSGCKRVRVRAVGGGGGGGATAAASQCCAASGGGSGGFGEGIYNVTGTSTVTVTIGAAGTAGAAANGNGGNGGTTSFGALLSANGGAGGSGMTSGTGASYMPAQPAAAVGLGGFVNAGGNSGLPSHRASATIFMSGQGAPSYLGGGGRGTSFEAAGSAGGAPGAGGAGAASSSATGFAGGAGAAGIVIVEEFY